MPDNNNYPGEIKKYQDYFTALATAYLPISHTPATPHFATVSREEVISNSRDDLNLEEWTLRLLPFEPRLADSGSRQFAMHFAAAFEVVKEPGRADLSHAAHIDTALSMCMELAAKIMTEHKERTLTLGDLSEGSIDFYEVNGAYGGTELGYGVEFTYTIGFDRSTLVKPDNWQ